jgi:hypothetical protein
LAKDKPLSGTRTDGPDVRHTGAEREAGKVLAAKRCVFAGITDPVGGGLVAGLTRPGGNSTGFINFEYGISTKWLELLKQIAPGVTREPIPTNARTELPKRGRKIISPAARAANLSEGDGRCRPLILFCTDNQHSLTADLTERKPRPGKSVIGGLRSTPSSG